MKRSAQKELFRIQARLFLLFYQRTNITIEAARKIFDIYHVFEYIETCYEEYHVQGDEANLLDILNYLERKGWTNG